MTEILALDETTARAHLDGLARVLHDCVEGGASVSFMWPFSLDEARTFFSGVIEALAARRLHLYAAFDDGKPVGTVQLWLDSPCNQRHRGDVRKLLVHREGRRLGIARALMQRLERDARAEKLSLLTLDTVPDSPAERLYMSLGFQRVGIIPRYALWPDGRFCDTGVFYKDLSSPSL
jgi:ribosomal protein S18 acetylase RimI-like enzyme